MRAGDHHAGVRVQRIGGEVHHRRGYPADIDDVDAAGAQAAREGKLDPTKETVIVNTGEGLKTLDAISSGSGFSATIAPSVASVADVIARGK